MQKFAQTSRKTLTTAHLYDTVDIMADGEMPGQVISMQGCGPFLFEILLFTPDLSVTQISGKGVSHHFPVSASLLRVTNEGKCFKSTESRDNEVSMRNPYSRSCPLILTVVIDNSTADGASVIQWDDNGGNNQQWSLVQV
jgi:hypothetical protein